MLRYLAASSSTAEIDVLRTVRVHAERAADERALIEVWDELGGAMLMGPTPYPEILDFVRAEVRWARDRGVAFTEADGMLGWAYALAGLGEVEEARRAIDTVRALLEALPSTVEQLGETWMLEAVLDRDAGDHLAAAAAYERAVAVFEACGEPGWVRSGLASLAHTNLDLGRTAVAAAMLERARSPGTSPAWFQVLVTVGDARVALQGGDADRAGALALKASAMIDEETTDRNAIRSLELLGDVLAATGDVDRARLEYEAARARAQAKGDRVAEPRLSDKLERTRGTAAPTTPGR